MSVDGIRYRPATPRDATVAAELMAAGFATYRGFAPPGWHSRPAIAHEGELHDVLSRGDVHARLALADDGIAAGIAGWTPARVKRGAPEVIPGRAHVWTLFVAERWWGSGLAAELLAWATTAMRDSGYATAQLWTPIGQARARAFYEREGWRATARREFNAQLGLDVVLYEIALSAGGAAAVPESAKP
jgi:GNAT superfamily N-acetyltransferase